jgi:hypothetical protein
LIKSEGIILDYINKFYVYYTIKKTKNILILKITTTITKTNSKAIVHKEIQLKYMIQLCFFKKYMMLSDQLSKIVYPIYLQAFKFMKYIA